MLPNKLLPPNPSLSLAPGMAVLGSEGRLEGLGKGNFTNSGLHEGFWIGLGSKKPCMGLLEDGLILINSV